jgi:succinate dehydrogenase / fumarate reductase, cytochrome b subunit
MAAKQRPLSPHLQVYKPQITSVLSIMHRGAGVVNAIGALGVMAWLLLVASNPDCYAMFMLHASAWYGKFIFFVFSASLIYHLLNGIRHLLWDIGWGFEIATVETTGKIVLFLATALTGLLWFFALRGGAL